jgi:hypothetical protein
VCERGGGHGEVRAVGWQWRRWVCSGGWWTAVGGDNAGWAAVALSFLSESGCRSGVGDCAHLSVLVTYDGPDPTIVSYLLFTLAWTGRCMLPLIYVS